jgi:hypothetical protein
MTEDRERDLGEAEIEALSSLRSEPPPPELEDRVVRALRVRGLLRGRSPHRGRWRLAAGGLAASLLSFLVGVAAGVRFSSPGPPRAGARYLLLLYEGTGYQSPAPGKERERAGEYGEWARRLRESGNLVAGEELKQGEEALGPPLVSDSPGNLHPEPRPRENLGGYFIISAADGEEARSIASTCPHLRHGGRIVIRRINSAQERPRGPGKGG